MSDNLDECTELAWILMASIALSEGTVIRDNSGDVSELRSELWCGYETASLTDRQMRKYLPATVLWEPSA